MVRRTGLRRNDEVPNTSTCGARMLDSIIVNHVISS